MRIPTSSTPHRPPFPLRPHRLTHQLPLRRRIIRTRAPPHMHIRHAWPMFAQAVMALQYGCGRGGERIKYACGQGIAFADFTGARGGEGGVSAEHG
jgi:hypothetical protein